MLRNASIRSRILAVLVLPVLVLVLAAALFSLQATTAARRIAQLRQVVAETAQVQQLSSALGAEASLSARAVSGDTAARQQLAADRAATDPLLVSVRTTLAGVDLHLLPTQSASAVRAALAAEAQVSVLRRQVDLASTPDGVPVGSYAAVVSAHTELPARIAGSVKDERVADALRAATAVQRVVDQVAVERDDGLAVLASGSKDSRDLRALEVAVAREDVQRDAARAAARPVGVSLPGRALGFTSALSAGFQIGPAQDAGPAQPTTSQPVPGSSPAAAAGTSQPLTAAAWRAATDSEARSLLPSRQRLAAEAATGVAAAEASVRRTALLYVAGAAVAVAVPVLLALLLARGITEPLRRLTLAAAEVRRRLPQLVEDAHTAGAAVELPIIPERSTDEVGRLAAAFNDVNATSVRVAQEQAALRAAIATTFVSVARRDQALLGKQLAFIDAMERREEDPRILSDLFTLDHLATRMRRNAESLLVLAGIDSGRRLRRPMSLSDVVRTASSEIEDYQRIDLSLGADPSVLGHLALPAAHLLAELLENATAASDPGTRVRVSTCDVPGGIAVTVADEGIGMTPEEIERARDRIADPSATAALGESQLGFFVVGRLAARLGARITLLPGMARGSIVTIDLPAAVFASDTLHAPDAAAAASAPPSRRAAQAPQPAPVPEPARLPVPLVPAELLQAVAEQAGPAYAPQAGAPARPGAPAPLPTRASVRAARAGRPLPAPAPAPAAARASAPVPEPSPGTVGVRPMTRRELRALETGTWTGPSAETAPAAPPASAPTAPPAAAPALARAAAAVSHVQLTPAQAYRPVRTHAGPVRPLARRRPAPTATGPTGLTGQRGQGGPGAAGGPPSPVPPPVRSAGSPAVRPRDAAQVRSTLTGFTSGAARGRTAPLRTVAAGRGAEGHAAAAVAVTTQDPESRREDVREHPGT